MQKLRYPNLRNGVVGAWCPSIDRSRSTILTDFSGYGNHGTLTNMDPATDWVASDGKIALDFDGSNDYVLIGGTVAAFTNVPFSISAWTRPNVTAFYQRLISRETHFIFGTLANEFMFGLGNAGGGWNSLVSFGSDATLTNGVLYHLAVSYSGTAVTGYVNGVNVGTITSAITSNASGLSIGWVPGQTNQAWNGTADDLRIYNRALTPSEIATLALRRGIAYETYRVPIVRGASGGGTTVTPTTAALVLTTFEPTVSITTTVVPTTTALVLTTFAPVVTTPQAITPTTAALTLTPFAATVSTPTLITPPEIDLTLTGYSPDIFTPILVTPTIVGLITTTFEPTITISADKIVIPTTLDLTLTTFAPNVALGGNQTATPTTVTLSLTTFSPTVTTSNAVEVVPDTNALTITTYAPTVSAPVTVTPGVLALTLTSYSATIVNPVTVTPTTRSLTLTTYAPNLGEEVVSNFNYYYMMIQGV